MPLPDDWASGSTNSIARLYAENHREIKDHEDAIKRLSKDKAEMQDVLLERFAEEGVRSVGVGKSNVHLHSIMWAGRQEDVTPEQAYDALLATGDEGLAEYATRAYSHQSISALFRELDKKAQQANREGVEHPDGEGVQWTLWDFVPPTLRGIFTTSVQTSVRVSDSKGS